MEWVHPYRRRRSTVITVLTESTAHHERTIKELLFDKLPGAAKPHCNIGYKLVRPIRKLQLEWNNAFTKMWDYGPYSEKELEGDGLRPVSEKGEGLIIPHPQRSIYCVLVVNSSSFSVAT